MDQKVRNVCCLGLIIPPKCETLRCPVLLSKIINYGGMKSFEF